MSDNRSHSAILTKFTNFRRTNTRIRPKCQSVQLKNTPFFQQDLSFAKLNNSNKIHNIRQHINKYLSKKDNQILEHQNVRISHKRNIKEYLNKFYSKDKERKSEQRQKKLLMEFQEPLQSPEVVNQSFSVKEMHPKRKGCNPYHIGFSQYDQIFQNAHSKYVSSSKRSIFKNKIKVRLKPPIYNNPYYQITRIPLTSQEKVKNRRNYQIANFVSLKEIPKIIEPLKPIQLAPWAKQIDQDYELEY